LDEIIGEIVRNSKFRGQLRAKVKKFKTKRPVCKRRAILGAIPNFSRD